MVERIGGAARDGFHAVECQWPFEFSRPQISSAIQESGIPTTEKAPYLCGNNLYGANYFCSGIVRFKLWLDRTSVVFSTCRSSLSLIM